ncbi:MAG: ABC transporter permease [Candidatus Nanopelagicales bacterium]|jgi:peptide/nickel transport system permease protein
MTAFIVRRVLIMLLLLLLLSFAVFFLFSILPADVARLTCGKICTDQTIELNRARLGLDKSIFEQYWLFLSAIFVGRTYGIGEGAVVCEAPCLGWSFTKSEPVLELILDRLPATVFLALGAFVIFLIGGVGLGVYSALRRGRWQDKTITGVSLIGYSLPSFFIGLVVIFFVIIRWQLLPFPDYVNPWEDPVQFLQTMILPWIVLAILYAAFYTRLTRSQMLETLSEDFIRTARAKGLKERTVIGKHALRAGLTPIVTAAGLDLAGLLGGAIILETIFSLPGLGSLAISAVLNPDQSILVGITLITATFIIVANLIVDILYAFIDPRVRPS